MLLPTIISLTRMLFKQTIDAAVANGSGIVFFPAGEFLVATNADTNAAGYNRGISIGGSNIVLRGSGSRDGGTIIRQVNVALAPDDNIYNPWFTIGSSGQRGQSGENTTLKITDVTADALRGSHWITVRNTSSLLVGQWVKLIMSTTDHDEINVYTYPKVATDISDFYRKNLAISINEINQVAEIKGNRVRFHSPIRTPIHASHGFSLHTFSPLEEIGVEDISFQWNILQKLYT